MFAIPMLTVGLILGCPPESGDTVTPAAKAPPVQVIAAEGQPLQIKRRALTSKGGVARLVSMEEEPGDVMIVGDDDDDAFIVSAKSAGAIPPGGPWLGLQFGPPAKSMRVQLGLEEGQGQVVLNVLEGSPADAAGFVQYDVITSIDGRSVPAELDKFIDMIKTFVPGETRNITYIRGAKPAQTAMTIGSRPEEVDATKYKYEPETEALSQNQVSNFGRILEKDKDGNWVMRDLGKLDNLGTDVWKMLPRTGGFSFSGPGDLKENIVVQKSINGTTIKVERKDGGDIIVSRTTEENGNTNTSVKTYANEQELEAADAEAHKMLSGSRRDLGQLGRDQWMFRNRLKLAPMDMLKQHEDTAKMYQQQAEELRKQAEAFRALGNQGSPLWVARQPKTSFELQTDGSVRVIVRQGDQELVEQFSSVDELKNNRPELYKKYQKLQSGQKE